MSVLKIWPEPPSDSLNDHLQEDEHDHFDRLPDSLLLVIFNRIADVKALGRCGVVSRRFHALVPQVEHVLVRVDCVISDDEASAAADKSRAAASTEPFSGLFRLFVASIAKPFQAFGQFLIPKRSSSPSSALAIGGGGGEDDDSDKGGFTHHSPTQVLKNFNKIRFLQIELPSAELEVDEGVLLKWRADFGSTLDDCVILGASAVTAPRTAKGSFGSLDLGDGFRGAVNVGGGDDSGSIPESFYTNGGLKLRVVWTISSLIAASARHYLLQPIIADHTTLDSLVLTDCDEQGVLCMNRYQLEELRVKPLSASSASKRTLVPALNMRLWYAPYLELPNGVVLKGATLVAIRPSEPRASNKVVPDLSLVSTAFEEPYGTAAKMLLKRRTYCLEMNSF